MFRRTSMELLCLRKYVFKTCSPSPGLACLHTYKRRWFFTWQVTIELCSSLPWEVIISPTYMDSSHSWISSWKRNSLRFTEHVETVLGWEGPKADSFGGWETITGHYYICLLLHSTFGHQREDTQLHTQPSKGTPAINEESGMRFPRHSFAYRRSHCSLGMGSTLHFQMMPFIAVRSGKVGIIYCKTLTHKCPR